MQSNETVLIAGMPHRTADSEPFWDGCNARTLLLQRCGLCDHIFYYARRLCPLCGSTTLKWEASSGYAKVYSYSEVHVPFQGPEWLSQLPYTVVLVDLVEGPRMLSRWIASDGRLPQIGEPVRVVFPSIEGQKVPFFEPSDSISS